MDYIVSPDKKYSGVRFLWTIFEYEIKLNDSYYDKGHLNQISTYDGSSWNNVGIKEDTIILEKIKYNLIVNNIDGLPIEGAKVEYSVTCNSRLMIKSDTLTNSEGIFSAYTYRNKNTNSLLYSALEYKIIKEGYYSKSGTLKPEYPTENVNIIKPIDYLNKEFVSSSKVEKLKANTIKFIDLILLQSLLSDSYLELQSINLIPFKKKDYLTFKFTNTNSYNSLKLNKYDIGKLLFDEVIRKILNPLNDYLGESKQFYGYDLSVIGHTKSFAETYAADQKINYRFMIPNEIVKKYKNKDISGQQVLDASVILMDDERIELKLQ